MVETSTVAVLGTGIMGLPMASRLLDHGFDVRAWNRSPDKAQPLAQQGATIADTPAEAASGAQAVITMLADAEAVRSVMSGPHGASGAMAAGGLWLQTSTVGVDDTDQLRALGDSAGITFVDAPVLGTKQPAEQGMLTVLAAGPQEAQQRCREIFTPLASKVMWVGAAGAGTRLKLVANTWVLAVTEASAECVALADSLDLDPNLFLEAITGGGLDLPYAHLKGGSMIRGEYPVSFPVRLAAKDARLVLQAGEANGVDLAVPRAVLTHMRRAEQLGHGDADMAAVYEAVRDPG